MGTVEIRVLQLSNKTPIEKREIHHECFLIHMVGLVDKLILQYILKLQKDYSIYNQTSWQAK